MDPKLYVVARPSFEVDELLRFLADEQTSWRRTDTATPAENIVEVAGRVCYMSFGNGQSLRENPDYLRNLIAKGHESVLEHAVWSFIISGVSRPFTHQLVRHRVGFSYSQLSQQYHNEGNAETWIPSIVRSNSELLEQWLACCSTAQDAYRAVIEKLNSDDRSPLGTLTPGERRRYIHTAARGILPNNTTTKIFVTANARAIRHFLGLRGSLEGDEEMRIVSALIFGAVTVDAPFLFSDFETDSLEDGTPVLRRCAPG